MPKQQNTTGNSAVFIRRQRRDAQRFQRGGHAKRLNRLQKIGDGHILKRIVEAVDPVRHLGVKEPAKAQIQARGGSFGSTAVPRARTGRGCSAGRRSACETTPARFPALRVVLDLIVLLIRRAVPFDKAAVAFDVQQRIGEKVLQAARRNI